MPLDRAREVKGHLLDGGAVVAGVKNEGLNVVVQEHRAVDLGLDVAVEKVRAQSAKLCAVGRGRQVGQGPRLVVRLRKFDERHGRGDAKVGGLENAVWVAESRPG